MSEDRWPADSALPPSASSIESSLSPEVEQMLSSIVVAALNRQSAAIEHLCELLAALIDQMATIIDPDGLEDGPEIPAQPQYLSPSKRKS